MKCQKYIARCYRVYQHERNENASFLSIFNGGGRPKWRFSNFPRFWKNSSALGSFNCIFENNSLKALFGQNMKKVKILKLSPDFRYLQKLALKGLWEGYTNTNNLHCRISTELKTKERPARRPQRRPPQNQPIFARECYLDLVSCVWNIIFRKRANKCADYSIYESDVSQEYTYLGTQTSSLVSLDFRSNHVLFIFDDNPDFTNLCM